MTARSCAAPDCRAVRSIAPTLSTLEKFLRRIDQHTGIEQAVRVEGVLRSTQRQGERLGTLPVVPRTVGTADRVVVGDRGAASSERLGCGCLDGAPLGELGSRPTSRDKGV